MSRGLAFAAPARAPRSSAKARTAGVAAPAKKSTLGEGHAEDTGPQWSFAAINLQAPEKISGKESRRRLPAEVRRALGSSLAEPLPLALEAEFGRKFGQNLSGVRIHRDVPASAAVESLGANAFARGTELYFRAGTYRPDSPAGRALLAHELAHVVQQVRGGATSPIDGTEEGARKAAQHYVAGRPFLNAGPAAPRMIAADNGFTYADDEAQVSVLGTEDEAADKVADMQAEADRQRAAAGATTAEVAARDERAQQLRDAVQNSVARKQAARVRGGKKAKKASKPPGPPPLNSSADLTDATPEQVAAYQHQLEKAIALTPGVNDRLAIQREQQNTEVTAGAAGDRARFKEIMAKIAEQRGDNEFLKGLVRQAHELRESTSSWVTGPTHLYGGAWNEIEIPEFASSNQSLSEAEKALKAGRFDEADALVKKSWDLWWDLNYRYEQYAEGIQKGGNRVVTTLRTVEKINRGAANLNPAVGFVYNFAQDSLQQRVEVAYGQRESVDYLGNLKNSAINTVVNKIAAGGSSFAGEAASPFLSNLGAFSGVGRQVVEQGTGILISSGLTGTSPIDALTDLPTYLVPFIGAGYSHGGGGPAEHGADAAPEVTPDSPAPALQSENATPNASADEALDASTSTPDDAQKVAKPATINPSLIDPSSAGTSPANPPRASSLVDATEQAGMQAPKNVSREQAADLVSIPDDATSSKVSQEDVAAEQLVNDADWSDVNHDLGLENPPPTTAIEGPGEPIHEITDPNKAKGTLAEVTVPFDRYPGPEWNNIGGGSETASSRANLARRSSTDVALGQEGTAGNDYLVKHRETGRLVIGEQKATKGDSFSDATAITSSLQDNVARDIEVLNDKLGTGAIKDPAEVADTHDTIDRLQQTLEALQKGANGEDVQLPEGVVFELTNLGGEGKLIGKQHIDLLAEDYGANPKFLDHLLERTAVRDPELAKAMKRDQSGKPGTDTDPGIVPAKDILTPPAKDTQDRLRAGKTEEQWQKEKAEQKAEGAQEETSRRKAARAAQKAQRAAEESAAREQARQAGERARQEKLNQLQEEKAQGNEPEPRTKRQRDNAARKLETEAKKAGKKVEKAKLDDFMKGRKQRDADAAAARRAQKRAEQEAKQQEQQTLEAQRALEEQKGEANRQAEIAAKARRKAMADAIRERYEARKAQEAAAAKQPSGVDAAAQGVDQPRHSNQADKPSQGANKDQRDLGSVATKRAEGNGAEGGRTGAGNTQSAPVEGQKTSDTKPSQSTGAEREKPSPTNEGQQPREGEGAGGRAVHAMNEAAGALRGYDAYDDARKQGKGRLEASLEAGKAYLSSTNPVAGAVTTAVQRMQKDEKGEQYYGNDKGDAILGTLGETVAGFIVPGKGWDQAANAAGNLTDAVDDHAQKNRDLKAPPNDKATARTGVDLATELTPSREFAAVIGAGARAYYDLGRAKAGDFTGVDKFGEDATRGKLGSVIQPWAMVAEFVGNLGSDKASVALDKTIKKTEGTTLKKAGDASGDAMYELGQNKKAKAGKYGAAVQGISDTLSITSDMIAGKSFEKALNEAADAGKGSLADTVGSAMGDAAFKTVEKGKEIFNEDIPSAKKKAGAVIDKSKQQIVDWWHKL